MAIHGRAEKAAARPAGILVASLLQLLVSGPAHFVGDNVTVAEGQPWAPAQANRR